MRLINIDDIIKFLDEEDSGDWSWDNGYNSAVSYISDKLNEIPTIDPLDTLGVCRCKNCIYLWHDANNDLFCAYKYGLKHPKETDYCPYAKRKENNNV